MKKGQEPDEAKWAGESIMSIRKVDERTGPCLSITKPGMRKKVKDNG
jgi:hypothetical protein